METELQRSLSPELQQSLSLEIVPLMPERRATRGKDVSASYSSLKPKGREKTTSSINISESILELPANKKSDTVLSFRIIINNY